MCLVTPSQSYFFPRKEAQLDVHGDIMATPDPYQARGCNAMWAWRCSRVKHLHRASEKMELGRAENGPKSHGAETKSQPRPIRSSNGRNAEPGGPLLPLLDEVYRVCPCYDEASPEKFWTTIPPDIPGRHRMGAVSSVRVSARCVVSKMMTANLAPPAVHRPRQQPVPDFTGQPTCLVSVGTVPCLG